MQRETTLVLLVLPINDDRLPLLVHNIKSLVPSKGHISFFFYKRASSIHL